MLLFFLNSVYVCVCVRLVNVLLRPEEAADALELESEVVVGLLMTKLNSGPLEKQCS